MKSWDGLIICPRDFRVESLAQNYFTGSEKITVNKHSNRFLYNIIYKARTTDTVQACVLHVPGVLMKDGHVDGSGLLSWSEGGSYLALSLHSPSDRVNSRNGSEL